MCAEKKKLVSVMKTHTANLHANLAIEQQYKQTMLVRYVARRRKHLFNCINARYREGRNLSGNCYPIYSVCCFAKNGQ